MTRRATLSDAFNVATISYAPEHLRVEVVMRWDGGALDTADIAAELWVPESEVARIIAAEQDRRYAERSAARAREVVDA